MKAHIWELWQREQRYAYEAYEFVCDAVRFTQQMLERRGEDEDERHVTARELLHGLVVLAVHQFGMLAPVVFKMWNVLTTDDVGRIVYQLIDIGELRRSERDQPEDFHNVFDLHEQLRQRFTLKLGPRAALHPQEPN